MNDVDTDKRRHIMGNEEGPDHRHNADERMCGQVGPVIFGIAGSLGTALG
jgi:hypothetical protein